MGKVAVLYGRGELREGQSHFDRTVCVGEDNCEPFITQNGDHRQKEKTVCGQCRAFPTKYRKGEDGTEQRLALLINRAFELRFTRMAGLPIDPHTMTAIEGQLIKRLEEQIADRERELLIESNRYLEVLLKRGLF